MTALYSWGANSHGQLGLGYVSEMCATPQLVQLVPFDSKNVKRIVGGGGHAFVLTTSGRFYACGWNHKGQLGIGSTKDVSEYVEGPTICSVVVEIACGWDSSAAIDADGVLYVWGSNAFGQLGMPKKSKPLLDVPIELELPHNRKPAKICFGLQYLCILCTDNLIYFVGRRSRPSIDHIVSGTYHIVFTSSGIKTVSGIGDNRFNQIQSASFDADIRKLCSGWTHIGVLTNDGDVYLYGRNTYGQLAHIDVTITNVVKLNCNDEFVDDLQLGSEHGMIQTRSGMVKTWGWNEHGNCGNGNVINVFEPVTVNLPGTCILSATGAGFCYVITTTDS